MLGMRPKTYWKIKKIADDFEKEALSELYRDYCLGIIIGEDFLSNNFQRIIDAHLKERNNVRF